MSKGAFEYRHTTGGSLRSRHDGLSLVEVVVGMVILATVSVAASLTLVSGIRHRREAFDRYTATTALRDLIAEIQDVANQKEDPVAGTGVSSLHAIYDGATLSVPSVSNGQAVVICHANELIVPPELGGPQDLNFDGDADDDLSTVQGGSDLKLVPMTIALTFESHGTAQTITSHRLITKTTQ